jgi:sugar phosphate isomerase/epimerase
MAAPSLERLCVHTATTRPLPLEVAIDEYLAAGVHGITVWTDALAGREPQAAGKRIRKAGLQIVSLCRGGFFVAPEAERRETAIEENRRLIRVAAELEAPLLVLVCGAHPEVGLFQARDQIRAGIESILPLAEELGIDLAVEPLHPVYAADRSAINTLSSANDLCDGIDHERCCVAVDVYHLWWDPNLEAGIARCGDRIRAFHVSDWRSPKDILLDRRLMGDGCIPIPEIRGWTEAAGFGGFIEVEIFSTELWAIDQRDYLGRIVNAYQHHG